MVKHAQAYLLVTALVTASLFISPVFSSGHAAPGSKRIVVSISDQRVYFLEEEHLVKTHICSTGMPGYPTPTGVFSVFSHQYEYHNERSVQYYNMFYSGHLAFHSILYVPSTGDWVGGDLLGTKASHGCIRQTLDDAAWAYSWTPDGTRVDIIDQHYDPPESAFDVSGGSCARSTATPSTTWFFAEGTCRPGFETYLCIHNPGKLGARVLLTFFKSSGPAEEREVEVPPGSRTTLRAKDLIKTGDPPADFGCSVKSVNGQPLVAESARYFYGRGTSGGDGSTGAPSPSRRWYFAEGSCRPGFDPYLCICNPGDSDASVIIRYMKGDGSTDEQGPFTVARRSRSTFRLKDRLGEGEDTAHDFSCLVQCVNSQPVVAERPTYFDNRGLAGCHNTAGATAGARRWYFAEGTTRAGFDQYLTILNPGRDAAELTMRYMLEGAGEVSVKATVPAKSRATFKPVDHVGPGKDVSLLVESNRNVVAERPVYFDYISADGRHCAGGHVVLGAGAPSRDWVFAEGTTRPGFEEWLCLQNPNASPITVHADFSTNPGEAPETRSYAIPAKERLTISVNGEIGPGVDVSVKLRSRHSFIAERPIYFSCRATIEKGLDSAGSGR